MSKVTHHQVCRAPGCDRRARARECCRKHYDRLRKHGTFDLPEPPTVEERFWEKVDKDGPHARGRDGRELGRCWLWTASLRNGYGAFCLSHGNAEYAHRFAYEQVVGPIPEGRVLDHLCERPECVNPEHLDPCSRFDNVARSDTWLRGVVVHNECKRGHKLEGDNVRVDAEGRRFCRECARMHARRYYHQQKA